MRYLSRFHRGRHRIGQRVSDIAARINRDYFGEYDPNGPAWQLMSDRRHLMFTGDIVIPKAFDEDDPKLLTINVDLPCPHDHREITYETEDFYSNGMFGLPASNMPITVDMYEKTICTDCEKELFPDPETGVMVCDVKQGCTKETM